MYRSESASGYDPFDQFLQPELPQPRKSLNRLIILLVAVIGLTSPQRADAKQPPAARPLRVFIDCQNIGCDLDYFRKEIGFVDYVRDRQEGDVHVLITSQSTGSGGREITFRFLHGTDERVMTRLTSVDATEDQIRQRVVQAIKVGLVSYVADTPAGEELQITHRASMAKTQTTSASDKWNYWVFRPRFNMFMNGESSQRSMSINGNIAANRVTEGSKIQLSLNGNYRQSTFDLEEGRIVSIRRGQGFTALAVKSLTPHWSAGAVATVNASTFNNQDLHFRAAPAIEYNFYPYSESTKRQLTFLYDIGADYYRYKEVTIFDKTSERLLRHGFDLSLTLKQPWGTADVSFQMRQFLSSPSKHRLQVFGDTELRIVKGLSLNFDGGIFRIRDQLSLPKGEISTEEVLLQQRQLATSYEYFFGLGISYSFGSIYNNVVNTRFRRVEF